MADCSVGDAFDAVGVVPGGFDDAGTAAVPAWWVGALADLRGGLGKRGVQVLRG